MYDGLEEVLGGGLALEVEGPLFAVAVELLGVYLLAEGLVVLVDIHALQLGVLDHLHVLDAHLVLVVGFLLLLSTVLFLVLVLSALLLVGGLLVSLLGVLFLFLVLLFLLVQLQIPDVDREVLPLLLHHVFLYFALAHEL